MEVDLDFSTPHSTKKMPTYIPIILVGAPLDSSVRYTHPTCMMHTVHTPHAVKLALVYLQPQTPTVHTKTHADTFHIRTQTGKGPLRQLTCKSSLVTVPGIPKINLTDKVYATEVTTNN